MIIKVKKKLHEKPWEYRVDVKANRTFEAARANTADGGGSN